MSIFRTIGAVASDDTKAHALTTLTIGVLSSQVNLTAAFFATGASAMLTSASLYQDCMDILQPAKTKARTFDRD